MHQFKGWKAVSDQLHHAAEEETGRLNPGQRASLQAIADRIGNNGIVLADEVGMGKTRIAVALARAVIECGGRVAILAPPGLGFQWLDELNHGGVEDTPPILRSLWGYLKAWESESATEHKPWFERPAVLVSHAFANWRLSERTSAWRWSLLPTLYSEWHKSVKGRYPRGFHNEDKLSDTWVNNAAGSIIKFALSGDGRSEKELLNELAEKTPWPRALEGGAYSRSADLRPWLERAVGLGLGTFDLVIVDEAHKSRGEEAGLSRLLDHIILPSSQARRLAMTATPVELDVAQWRQTLTRIGVESQAASTIGLTIDEYAKAIKRVRQSWRTSEEARNTYKAAAARFEQALMPFLLRRDKREDDAVKLFARHSRRGIDSYRQEVEISIEAEQLPTPWKKAICAAEALSIAGRQQDDSSAKRLRLTLGNGHGIATLIDQVRRDESEDRKQEQVDASAGLPAEGLAPVLGTSSSRKAQRAAWWKREIEAAFTGAEAGLFDHPALLATVKAVEEYNSKSEKVLIFGRFTRPLRALTDLLNARQMLRALMDNQSWPQSKIHHSDDNGEWLAVQAAHRQLGCTIPLAQIDQHLEANYMQLERRREQFRASLYSSIREGLGEHEQSLGAILRSAEKSSDPDTRAILARALDEMLPDTGERSAALIAEAFSDLVAAVRDRDAGDDNADGQLDENEAEVLWPEIYARLADEYGGNRGRFARLMYGETRQETRRILQLAFNRPSSLTRVLVAQSMVGREGLNLHQACRVVILLHPEWNPGVVEQQIGRVDRVGSHWAKLLDTPIADSVTFEDLPRIEVRPVIFKGTYDQHQWAILQERWDDLRAQLHGVVVPQRVRALNDEAGASLIAELDQAGPNFSPMRNQT